MGSREKSAAGTAYSVSLRNPRPGQRQMAGAESACTFRFSLSVSDRKADAGAKPRERPKPQIGVCRVWHSPPGRPPANEAFAVNALPGNRVSAETVGRRTRSRRPGGVRKRRMSPSEPEEVGGWVGEIPPLAPLGRNDSGKRAFDRNDSVGCVSLFPVIPTEGAERPSGGISHDHTSQER